jgi:hypothetical protein
MEKNDSKVDLKLFIRTLLPSTTSAIWSVAAGVLFCITVIFLSRYRTSSLHKGYINYVSGHSLTPSFLDKSIFSTGIVGNALIFAFWLVAGVIVYVLAVDIVKGLKSTFEVEQELSYVHLDRSALLKYTFTRLLIRLGTWIIWLPYLYEFFHSLLPAAAYLSIAASGATSLALRPVDAALSILLVAVTIHINIVLLRLVLLRTRVFNNQILS